MMMIMMMMMMMMMMTGRTTKIGRSSLLNTA